MEFLNSFWFWSCVVSWAAYAWQYYLYDKMEAAHEELKKKYEQLTDDYWVAQGQLARQTKQEEEFRDAVLRDKIREGGYID